MSKSAIFYTSGYLGNTTEVLTALICRLFYTFLYFSTLGILNKAQTP